MSLSPLMIEMMANTLRLQRDMEKAVALVGGSMKQIESIANTTNNVVNAAFLGLSVAGIGEFIKKGIEAGDEMGKMAQKTGLAVSQVAGVELAYKQAGMGADVMQSSISKLSVGIANNSDALKAMGVQTRNTDGTLRSTRDVLSDVSSKFSGYADGTAKTALAVNLFGKAGADLIPLLNGGADSLAAYDAMAAKLGLTMTEETAKSAENFNDTMELVGLSSQGLSQQLAAKLLPSLSGIASAMLDVVTSEGAINTATTLISGGFKILTTIALEVAKTFSDVGNWMGAIGAAAVQLAQGNFKTAWQTIQDGANDSAAIVEKYDKRIRMVWDNDPTASAMAKIVAEGKKVPPVVSDIADAAKKSADELKKLSDELENYGRQGYALASKMVADAQDAESKLIQGVRDSLSSETEKVAAAYEQQRKVILESTQITEESRTELLARALSKRDEQMVSAMETESKKRKTYAEQQAEDAQKEWDKVADQIGQSLTDALMKGGKSAWEYIVDLFRTTVIRTTIQPVLTGMVGAVGGMFGMPSAALAGTGGASSSMGIIDSLKNVYSAITGSFDKIAMGVESTMIDVGSWMASSGNSLMKSAGESIIHGSASVGSAAGYMAGAAAGYAVGNYISGGYSIGGMNSNTPVIAGTVIGSIVGGPLGGALGGALGGIVNKAFGQGEKKVTDYGIDGTLSADGNSLSTYQDWKRKGGWFSSGLKGSTPGDLSSGLSDYLDTAIQVTSAAVKQYAEIIGLSAQAVDGFSQRIHLSLNGLSGADVDKAIQGAIAGFSDAMVQSAYDAILPFAKTGETASDTLTRLGDSITTVNNTFDTLGLKLEDVSVSGAAAASALLDAFGGMEAFTKSMDFYYQNFYSQQERTQKITESLTKSLGALGYAMPESRDQFRALIDAARTAGDPSLLANLLSLAPAFASITPTIEAAAAAAEQAGVVVSGVVVGMKKAMREATAAYNQNIVSTSGLASPTADLLDALDQRTRLIAFGVDGNGLENAKTQAKVLGELTAKAVRNALERAGAVQMIFNGDDGGLQRYLGTFKGDRGLVPALKLLNDFALKIPDVEKSLTGLIDFAIDPTRHTSKFGIALASNIDQSGLSGQALNSVRDLAVLAAQKTALGFLQGDGIAGVLGAQKSLDLLRKSTASYQTAIHDLDYELSVGIVSQGEYATAIGFAADMTIKAGGQLTDAAFRLAQDSAKWALSVAGTNSVNFYLDKISESVKKMNKAAQDAAEPISVLAQVVGRMKSAAYVFGSSADAIIPKNATKAMGEAIASVASDAAGWLNTQGGASVKAALGGNPIFAGVDWQKIGPMLDSISAFNIGGYEDAFTRVTDALGTGALTIEQYNGVMGYAKTLFLDTAKSAKTATQSAADLASLLSGAVESMNSQITYSLRDRMMARAQIESSLAIANAGGALPALDSIKGAVDILKQDASGMFATRTDYLRDFYGAKNSMAQLGEVANRRATLVDVVDELKSLRAEVKNLRTETQVTAINTGKTARILDSVSQDGTALSTTPAI